MSEKNVFHTSSTYSHVFRVLDKHYPRMVEKYFAEMKSRSIPMEPFLLASLVRVFYEIGDMEQVHALYQEAKTKSQNGQVNMITPQLMINLLRAYQNDKDRSDLVIADVTNYGLMNKDSVQAELISFYAAKGRHEELLRIVNGLEHKSLAVFRVLLKDAYRKLDKKKFYGLLSELRASHVRLNDRLFGTILTGLSRFNDLPGVQRFMTEARDSDAIRQAGFFADAAGAFAKLHDWRSVDETWEQLLSSEVPISMGVYNRFLELYMSHSQMDKVQAVLDTMMKNVPPNPITATTVVDMLGKMGKLNEMEALLDEMSRSKNATPTLVTYHQAMNAYAKAGDIQKLEAMREKIRNHGLHENHVTYNILAEGYGRAKRFEHLQDLIAERRSKNIPMEEFGYVILLNIFSRAKLGDEVEKLIQEILQSKLALSTRMIGTIATALSMVGDAQGVERYVHMILAHPQKSERDVETVCLIYSRMRDVRRLQLLLDDDSVRKTSFMFNICIAAFSKSGEYTKVGILLQRMESSKMSLNRSTAVALSSALLRAGKLQMAQAVLNMRPVRDGESERTPQVPAPTPVAPKEDTIVEDEVDTLLLQRNEEVLQSSVSDGIKLVQHDDHDELH
jgi:pentatricopeptide repeat protein